MLCKRPYMLGVLPCGCGQCLPCRINRRRLWSHRMMLESVSHAASAFVTLTYSQANLPSGSTLVPKHPQMWLKRLRKALEPTKVRYFLVGEYGSKTNRPHYHAAIFGLDPLIGGGDDGRKGIVHDTWCRPGCKTSQRLVDPDCRGFSYTGDLSSNSASYICGYVTKKMSKQDDPRLMGRYPEFARMSLKPGIGHSAMMDVATSFGEDHLKYMEENADVPSVLQHGKRKLPLGRYLKGILRQNLGYGRKSSEESLQKFQEKMRCMFEDEVLQAKMENRAIKNYYQLHEGRIKSIEAMYKIKNTEGSL